MERLIDNAPIPIFYKSIDGKYIIVNTMYADLLGFTKEQMLGKTVFEIAPLGVCRSPKVESL